MCGAIVLWVPLYGLSHPDAVSEYTRLKQIGTFSEDGKSVTITQDQLDAYIKSHIGETLSLPSGIADFWIDAGLETVGEKSATLLKTVVLKPLSIGTRFEVMVSQDEYTKALKEEGSVAAALTNPYGDGCSTM